MDKNLAEFQEKVAGFQVDVHSPRLGLADASAASHHRFIECANEVVVVAV